MSNSTDRACCVCGQVVQHYKTTGQKNRPAFLSIYLTMFYQKAQSGKQHQPCAKVPICESCIEAAIGAPDGTYGPQASKFAGALLRSIRDRYNSMRGKKAA